MTAIEFQYQLVNLQKCLKNFAFRLTSDNDDAKDLVQETFLKALKYSDTFVHETNIKAWTFTIMKNTFLNNYRRAVRRNTHPDESKIGYYITHMHAPGSYNPDSELARKEIENIIEELDDNYKLPFKMFNDGFKYKEIAEKLDLNVGTVKSRIFLSRKQLKEQLKR